MTFGFAPKAPKMTSAIPAFSVASSTFEIFVRHNGRQIGRKIDNYELPLDHS